MSEFKRSQNVVAARVSVAAASVLTPLLDAEPVESDVVAVAGALESTVLGARRVLEHLADEFYQSQRDVHVGARSHVSLP
ncbi:hypothetical protein [Pseudonocardia sp. ICBG601]|uniref:hypothetical protein n=1 Tax=Pseudonocardia sp. ICBG601 TaxID=2846759 RepID=UPI001CF69E96|nr:hypothetical protein [Pseudonocardia sp. ICBG601]